MSFSVLTMLAPSAPSRLLGVRSGGRGAEECVHFGGVCVCFAGARGMRALRRSASRHGEAAVLDMMQLTTTQPH